MATQRLPIVKAELLCQLNLEIKTADRSGKVQVDLLGADGPDPSSFTSWLGSALIKINTKFTENSPCVFAARRDTDPVMPTGMMYLI